MEVNTNSAIRANNRKKLVNLLFREGQMTKLELAQRLEISVPTVTTILNGLMETGLVQMGEALNSTGGRKAVCFLPALGAKYALGADASEQGLYFVLLDLGGNIIAREYHPVKRDNTKEYWQQVDVLLEDFAHRQLETTDNLLDVGITLEIPMEEERVLQEIGKESVDLELARQCLTHKVFFRNSTKMAALAQVWNQGFSESFIFVKVGNHLNSAPVYQGNVLDFGSVNGALGSLILPDLAGKEKKTLEEIMGARVLLERAGAASVGELFERIDQKEERAVAVWEEYLSGLALILYNLNCMYSWKIVLGGMLSPQIKKDSHILQQKLEEYAACFPGKQPRFVFSELGEYAAGTGAAMLPIDHFLENIK